MFDNVDSFSNQTEVNKCSNEQLIELLYEIVKADKYARAFVSVKLEGEPAVLEVLTVCKEQIGKEFYPTRGFPKLRVAEVKRMFSEMKTIGRGTIWPFELLVYFCEIAVQYIHENGDIFENMGDYFTETYEEVIQILNKEKLPDLYEKYRERVKTIVDTTGCECWGIHDSLEGSYSMLKWVDHDEEEEDSPDPISYPAILDIEALSEDANLIRQVQSSREDRAAKIPTEN